MINTGFTQCYDFLDDTLVTVVNKEGDYCNLNCVMESAGLTLKCVFMTESVKYLDHVRWFTSVT